jgi:uncharacterized lipoprotein YddW (UPF0748 family)
VIPDADDARANRLQDWREWARAGLLDTVCPMIYTTDADAFRVSVDRVKSDAGPAAVLGRHRRVSAVPGAHR